MVLRNRLFGSATLGLAAAVAMLVFASGLESAWHAHVPHATPHEGTAFHTDDDDGGIASCSLCRLAHQVSAVPIVPCAVGQPCAPKAAATTAPAALTAHGIEPSRSPRAPPSASSC